MIYADFNSLSKKQLLKLLAVLTLSEGYIHYIRGRPHCIRLNTLASSASQHEFFSGLCYQLFSKRPNEYILRKKVGEKETLFKSSELCSVESIKKLLALSPIFKTSPANQNAADYLSSLQPTLSFLFSESDSVKRLALRVYFDFDGSVVPSFRVRHKKDLKNGKTYEYYQVKFECDINIAETNPNLARQLVELCSVLGLKANLSKDSRKWSKLNGIRISDYPSVRKFLEFGGPITDIILSSKSKRFKGVTKKAMCAASAEIVNNKGLLSRHFKNFEEAITYKNKLDKILRKEIKKFQDSPVV